MSTPSIFHYADVATLVDNVKRLPRGENDVVLLFIAEHAAVDVQAFWTALNQEKIPIAGGVFPGVIYGDHKYDASMVADVVPMAAAPNVVTGLDGTSFQLGNIPELSGQGKCTALVLVDGLTKHVAFFLDSLFKRMGNKVSYIGGGAGSLSFQQKPCIFDSQGLYQDAALVLWLKTTTSLGVRHGWQSLSGMYIAKQTEGTHVQKLYNKPAFQVYNQIIRARTGKSLTKENFFDLAKEHPLGIFHPRMDFIVRDPIAFTDDGALVCVGEVPPSSLVYILRGDKHSLIQNAQMATNDAMRANVAGHHNLIVDCISRVLYLEDDFDKELNAVLRALPSNASMPYGILTLGEIATFMTGRVEFFNKTIVVGSLRNIA